MYLEELKKEQKKALKTYNNNDINYYNILIYNIRQQQRQEREEQREREREERTNNKILKIIEREL